MASIVDSVPVQENCESIYDVDYILLLIVILLLVMCILICFRTFVGKKSSDSIIKNNNKTGDSIINTIGEDSESFINVSQEQYINDFVKNNIDKFQSNDFVIEDGVCKCDNGSDCYGGNVCEYTGFIRLLHEKYDLSRCCDFLCRSLPNEDCCIYICGNFADWFPDEECFNRDEFYNYMSLEKHLGSGFSEKSFDFFQYICVFNSKKDKLDFLNKFNIKDEYSVNRLDLNGMSIDDKMDAAKVYDRIKLDAAKVGSKVMQSCDNKSCDNKDLFEYVYNIMIGKALDFPGKIFVGSFFDRSFCTGYQSYDDFVDCIHGKGGDVIKSKSRKRVDDSIAFRKALDDAIVKNLKKSHDDVKFKEPSLINPSEDMPAESIKTDYALNFSEAEIYIKNFVDSNMGLLPKNLVIENGVCKCDNGSDCYGGNVREYTGFIRLFIKRYCKLSTNYDISFNSLPNEDCCIYICGNFADWLTDEECFNRDEFCYYMGDRLALSYSKDSFDFFEYICVFNSKKDKLDFLNKFNIPEEYYVTLSDSMSYIDKNNSSKAYENMEELIGECNKDLFEYVYNIMIGKALNFPGKIFVGSCFSRSFCTAYQSYDDFVDCIHGKGGDIIKKKSMERVEAYIEYKKRMDQKLRQRFPNMKFKEPVLTSSKDIPADLIKTDYALNFSEADIYIKNFIKNNIDKFKLIDAVINDGVCKYKDGSDYYAGNVREYTGFIKLFHEKYWDTFEMSDIYFHSLPNEDCCVYICGNLGEWFDNDSGEFYKYMYLKKGLGLNSKEECFGLFEYICIFNSKKDKDDFLNKFNIKNKKYAGELDLKSMSMDDKMDAAKVYEKVKRPDLNKDFFEYVYNIMIGKALNFPGKIFVGSCRGRGSFFSGYQSYNDFVDCIHGEGANIIKREIQEKLDCYNKLNIGVDALIAALKSK